MKEYVRQTARAAYATGTFPVQYEPGRKPMPQPPAPAPYIPGGGDDPGPRRIPRDERLGEAIKRLNKRMEEIDKDAARKFRQRTGE